MISHMWYDASEANSRRPWQVFSADGKRRYCVLENLEGKPVAGALLSVEEC
jgi:hypothetical protein